ncbi:MAG: hypothetical protein ABEI98_01480 [Halorhabdus sp.]
MDADSQRRRLDAVLFLSLLNLAVLLGIGFKYAFEETFAVLVFGALIGYGHFRS